ncbi:CoA-transferase [Mesorhizobium sp. Root554]|uniref:CaiB/BaiF CoA transferase family protein n=1 Tax=unclassified Mesorhizobium TaxID=325217 RepID=UPI0006FE0492|nr:MULTISPECIES: CaiB/BaiF CoA-transferase family protein [unclassified Mesorhizobium]KQZ15653.1 CoA-transferase [Mesorhizobium sp. Root1471]KQZ38161.1 CoA-transferase [Mesorhizobium sp. Root554]
MSDVHSMRPFDGIRVLDITHVLAAPFATYQLAVFGADVIRIENPHDPDQTRTDGVDPALSKDRIGTHFIIQNGGKRSLTLDLKSEAGRDVLRRLVPTADVLVENFRPGAMKALGLGYSDLRVLNPRLIYASISAFGQEGPRCGQTGYDQVIQAVSGMMMVNGTAETVPMKVGTPAIDYSTGAMGAFAIAAALLQRERTGNGQYIDLSMLDTALMLLGAHLTNHSRSGREPKAGGNQHEFATVGLYDTADGKLQLAAINLRQQRRLWELLGHPELVKSDNEQRRADAQREREVLQPILLSKTAQQWEEWFQANHIPAARIWTLPETLAHPQLQSRDILHRFDNEPGIAGSITVPKAAFKLAHGGARMDRPPPRMGEHSEHLLDELGYTAKEIAALRKAGTI